MAEDNQGKQGRAAPSGGTEIDRSLPARILQIVREEQPYREKWSEDLKILLDPNIKARSVELPMVGTFKVRNPDYRYYWVRLKRGANPDSSRYQQVKAWGFENASAWDEKENPTGDVQIVVADLGNSWTEIFSGDRILMKAPREVYDAFIRQHMLDSVRMTVGAAQGQLADVDPYRRMNTVNTRPMRTIDFGAGASSSADFQGQREGNIDVEQVMSRTVPYNRDVATGNYEADTAITQKKVDAARRGT